MGKKSTGPQSAPEKNFISSNHSPEPTKKSSSVNFSEPPGHPCGVSPLHLPLSHLPTSIIPKKAQRKRQNTRPASDRIPESEKKRRLVFKFGFTTSFSLAPRCKNKNRNNKIIKKPHRPKKTKKTKQPTPRSRNPNEAEIPAVL